MSDKKKMVNVGTIGHIDHNKAVISEAMGRAFLGSVQKIEHPEVAILKQRITELEQQLKTAKPKLYRHIKSGGIYEFIADAEMESNLEDVVVYQSVEHKTVWVRPSSEFYDGRFEEYANNLDGK